MPNMNDPAELTFYYTAPLFLPCTIEDPNFLGVYSSTSALPTTANNFNTAGVAGTGAMYVYLNNSWQFVGQYLYDTYRYLVYYQGSAFASASGTKWTSIFNDIASNSSLMTEFSANSASASNLSASSIAMNAIAGSSTAMNAILPSSTYVNTWWGSSYYVGLGLNTYTGLNNSTLAGLNTVSAIAGNSTAMSAIAGSSTAMTAIIASYTAMNAIAGSSTAMQAIGNSTTAMSAILPSSTYVNTWWGSSYYVGLGLNTYAGLSNSTLAGLSTVSAIAGNSTAMSAIAGSSTAMTAIIASYTAMNAMTTATAMNAFVSASSQLSIIQTLVSNINSGSIALGGGTAGSSSALGSNALLVLLSYDNGAAVPAGNATSSPTPTLAQKMYSAYSPTQYNYAPSSNTYTAAVTLATNQILFAVGAYASLHGSSSGVSNTAGYNDPANIIWFLAENSMTYPNEGTSPLLLSGTLYVQAEGGCMDPVSTTYCYLTYTPS